MIELAPKVKEALIKIDFVKRYEELSHKYDSNRTPEEERLVYLDGEEVMETIANLGYKPKFDSKEKFFKIEEEKLCNFAFGFHIILRDGAADFVWVVKDNDKLLLGSPWGRYSRLLINPQYLIKRPIFGDYDDIDKILKIAFQMYEDFKKAMISVSN